MEEASHEEVIRKGTVNMSQFFNINLSWFQVISRD